MRTSVTKREVLDAIRRGLYACKVDHDDAEFFASHVLEELAKAGIVSLKTPEEEILERVYGSDHARRQGEISQLGLEGGEPVE